MPNNKKKKHWKPTPKNEIGKLAPREDDWNLPGAGNLMVGRTRGKIVPLERPPTPERITAAPSLESSVTPEGTSESGIAGVPLPAFHCRHSFHCRCSRGTIGGIDQKSVFQRLTIFR